MKEKHKIADAEVTVFLFIYFLGLNFRPHSLKSAVWRHRPFGLVLHPRHLKKGSITSLSKLFPYVLQRAFSKCPEVLVVFVYVVCFTFFQVEFKGLVLYKMLIVILYSIAYFFFVKHRSRCLPEFSCCSFFMQWKHMVDRGCQAQKLMEKHTIIYISSLMICKNMPFKKTKEVWIGESANEIWLEELCTRTVVFGCIDKSGMTYLHAPYLNITIVN